MILISHRGNIYGSEPKLENSPKQIEKVLSMGYDVEIDVWVENNEILLGHDKGEYKIDLNFLKNDKLWCHTKNIYALNLLLKNNVHCFWHQNDQYTLTSKGFVWVYPGEKLIENCIAVKPKNINDCLLAKCKGVCSDFVGSYAKNS